MTLFDILGIATLAVVPLFIVLDLVHQPRSFEKPKHWRLRATAVTIFTVGLSFVIPVFWSRVTGENSLFDLSWLGHWAGAIVGVLGYEVLAYAYHRSLHESDFLFQKIHQMHHSAESLDAFSANYIAPHDAFVFGSLSSLVFFPILGLTTEAGVIGALFLTFNAVFQHANLRTPRWLGYFIQRPESHILHHQRRLHRYNYSDLPVLDMIFGTFRNPVDVEPLCGYYNGASSRIGDMLLGRDVTVDPAAATDDQVVLLEQAA